MSLHSHLALAAAAAALLSGRGAHAQAPARTAAGAPAPSPFFGRPVRITGLPGRPVPPRLSGTLRVLATDSVILNADSVQIAVAADDPTRMVRVPCGACVETRLALTHLARVEVATPPAADAWKRTRRRGVLWGALFGGASFAGVQATRSGGEKLVGPAVAGVILGAWLGGTVGAGWPQRAVWQTVYEAPGQR